MTEQVEYDRKDLKILALKERIAHIVVDYEDRDADRRIELTENREQIKNLQGLVESLSTELEELRETDVVSEDEDLSHSPE